MLFVFSLNIEAQEYLFKSVDSRIKIDKEWSEWKYSDEDIKIINVGEGIYVITEFWPDGAWRREKVEYIKTYRDGGYQYKSIQTDFESDRAVYGHYIAIISSIPLSKIANGEDGILRIITNKMIIEFDCRK